MRKRIFWTMMTLLSIAGLVISTNANWPSFITVPFGMQTFFLVVALGLEDR
jgi:hypothetical protein